MIGIIVTSSCTKKPEASISTSTKDAKVSQSVKFTSTSKNAKSVKWTFPDGQTFNSNEVDFTFTSPGDKQVKLEAFSKNQKKKSEASITIKVEDDKGDLTVWVEDDGSWDDIDYIEATINGVTKEITVLLNSSPSCGYAGCANFTDLKAGKYTLEVYAEDIYGDGYEDTFQVTIEGGVCLMYQIE